MAIDLGPVPSSVTRADRCWRVEVFFRDDGTTLLDMHREIVAVNSENNNVIRDRNVVPVVIRNNSQVDGKTYTIKMTDFTRQANVKATGAEIIALLLQMTDDERQVDIDSGRI